MYCVKCGVRLQDGTKECPLCGTPVWDPDNKEKEHTYPERLPMHYMESTMPIAAIFTLISIISILVLLAICLILYGRLNWGGYAIFGVTLFYILFIFPLWFKKYPIEVLIPVNHLAIGLYVLYICLKTGGKWFLGFAMPIIIASCIVLTSAACLLKHIRKGKLYIFGGIFILLGGMTMLIELFEHITFKTVMFRWSPYSFSGFAIIGLFLILVGMIPSLKESFEKKFFF